jgi:phosphotransferase system HPr (HPr) family protein
MIQRSLLVCNRLGLHARAAAKLVQLANKFQSQVSVSTNHMSADAKSILGVLTLAAAKDTHLLVEVRGPDEERAMAEIAELIEGKFGEE